MKFSRLIAFATIFVVAGCGTSPEPSTTVAKPVNNKNVPSFTLFWSEYPSWSAFGVADKLGLIKGAKGVLGPIEQKWGVDIVLKQADYDPCITAYGSEQADAVCITNMDVLSPSLSRNSVAICVTSTSYGADAVITTNDIKSMSDLKGREIYGLDKSVSQYLVMRLLQQANMTEKDIKYHGIDPGAAAQAMQNGQKGFEAIAVWEPYLSQSLAKRKDIHVLGDSTKIKNEIYDMVVVGKDVLDKTGGENFAYALNDAYYEVNKWLADPKTTDTTHAALGEKFTNLTAEQMKDVLTRCKFFSTPDKGVSAFTDSNLPVVMNGVVSFCKDHGMVSQNPVISYGKPVANATPSGGKPVNLTFESRFMATVYDKK